MKEIIPIAQKFDIGRVTNVSNYGSGLINETYLVQNSDNQKFVLQNLHKLITKEVLIDIDIITNELESKNIITPKLLKTHSGGLFIDIDRSIWRMFTYIKGVTIEKFTNKNLANSAGRLIGSFHRALVDCKHQFQHKIPNFHDTKFIINNLIKVTDIFINSEKHKQLNHLADFVFTEYKNIENSLTGLPERVIHGDLKLNNIRFDEKEQQAICLIDLDTVGTNKIAIDIGDAVRSCCNDENKFNLEILENLLEGYFSSASFITEKEIKSIPAGIETIILELAARYITDAYEEKYFKLDKIKFNSLYDQNESKAESLIMLYNDFQNNLDIIQDITANIVISKKLTL